MRNTFSYLILSAVLIFSSCKKKETEAETPETPITVCEKTLVTVNTDITTPTVWDECHIYVISSNQISVTSTLTIQPGTIIKFKEICGDNAILVSNSGQINAIGTSEKPIVFTSYKDDANGGDSNADGSTTSPARKDWGGIILNSNTCVFKYCTFKYGGEGPSAGAGQPSLEFSSYYGIIDNCTFANCGGENTYNGYGVVDARDCYNTKFSITNCTFYGCIKPLFISPFLSIDNSNTFHNPANTSQKNDLNGIFITNDSNEPTSNVSWLETEVPFVLSGSLYLGDGLKLLLAENVIIKVSDQPSVGSNKISIKEGSSSIEGYNLPGVVFTSYHDDSRGGDTNGNGNGSSPGSTDWYGIQDISGTLTTSNSCYTWSNILYRKYP